MSYSFADSLSDLEEVRNLLTDDSGSLTPFDKARQSIGRSICRAASSNPGQFFTSTTGTGLGIEYACRPYWESEGDPGPSDGVPLPGGQCPGVSYSISVLVDDARNAFCSAGYILRRTSVTGPLSGLSLERGAATIDCGGTEYTVGTIYVRDGSGNKLPLIPTVGPQATYYPPGGLAPNSITITRNDGQPDNCGTEEPSPIPGSGPPQSLPTSGGGTPDELPWTIGSPIKVDPRGIPIPIPGLPPFNISIPITIEDIPITFNIGGSSGGQPRPQPFQPQSPGDVGSPGSPSTTGAGGEANGEDPDRYLAGVAVELLQVGPKPNVRVRGTEEFHVGVLTVEMGTDSGLDQSPEAQFFTSGQFFYAQEGSNKWRVRTYLGYDVRVTPYYREAD